eukprot:scaffold22158_cov73-Phaeocystis_antarctica.AAC.1
MAHSKARLQAFGKRPGSAILRKPRWRRCRRILAPKTLWEHSPVGETSLTLGYSNEPTLVLALAQLRVSQLNRLRTAPRSSDRWARPACPCRAWHEDEPTADVARSIVSIFSPRLQSAPRLQSSAVGCCSRPATSGG